jgi:hypothetical protein
MRNFWVEIDGLVLGADCDGLGRAVNQIQALVQTDPHLKNNQTIYKIKCIIFS